MIWRNSIKAKWMIVGILFGSLFPIAGTFLQIHLLNMPFSLESIVQIQLAEKLLWIVDLAPLVLGTIFTFIGRREYKLQQTNYLLNKTNQQLSKLHTHLEQLVEERTAELAITSEQATQRANQFRTVADLAYSLATITNLESLLKQTTQLVSQRMGYYHTGIFLVDDTRQYAVLKAANSAGGMIMIAREHRLRVGSEGIVGFVTSRGIPRITLDVGTDSVHFENPDLPDTRSEVALPLIYGDIIIGALDIQSTDLNAFSSEDITVLEVLANQLAIVIQNARSLGQAQVAIAQAEAAAHQLIGQAWSNIKSYTPITGYRFDGLNPAPLTQSKTGRLLESQENMYSIPLKLRGEAIGSLRINPPREGQRLSQDEITVIQATADRVALAVENARLVAESQKRASKERVIAEIGTKISSSINIRNVLQTAVEELGNALPGAEVVIQLKDKVEPGGSN